MNTIISSICEAVPTKPGEGSPTQPANQQGNTSSSSVSISIIGMVNWSIGDCDWLALPVLSHLYIQGWFIGHIRVLLEVSPDVNFQNKSLIQIIIRFKTRDVLTFWHCLQKWNGVFWLEFERWFISKMPDKLKDWSKSATLVVSPPSVSTPVPAHQTKCHKNHLRHQSYQLDRYHHCRPFFRAAEVFSTGKLFSLGRMDWDRPLGEEIMTTSSMESPELSGMMVMIKMIMIFNGNHDNYDDNYDDDNEGEISRFLQIQATSWKCTENWQWAPMWKHQVKRKRKFETLWQCLYLIWI